MKCSLCGAELVQGNNTCPSCGALNMAFNQASAPANTPVESAPPTQEEVTEVLEAPQQAPAPTQSVPSPQVEQIEEFNPTPDDGVEVLEMPSKAEASQEGEVIDASTSGFVDLDEGEVEVVQATEDMAAPSLDINNENLTATAHDISANDNVSTYDPTQAVPEDVSEEDMPKEAGINFTLPEVKEASEDTQGMGIMEIETKGETVGEESKPVKEKFSLKIFRKKTLPRNVVLILLGVVLIIGILLGSLLFGKKVYTPGGSTQVKKGNNIPHVADGKNNTTFAGNIIYKIPQQYDFDKENGGVSIYGTADEYRIFIKAVKGSYEKIANSKDSIRLTLDNVELRTESVYETKVNDNNYIVMNSQSNLKNKMYAIRSGINDYLFYIEIMTADNNYDATLLKIADDIINNVEVNEKYTTMEKFVLDDVATLIVTTANEKNNA